MLFEKGYQSNKCSLFARVHQMKHLNSIMRDGKTEEERITVQNGHSWEEKEILIFPHKFWTILKIAIFLYFAFPSESPSETKLTG